MDHIDYDDHNPATAELLEDAYVSPIDVETAARHLWVIHKEAARLQKLRASLPLRDTGPTEFSEADRRHPGHDRRAGQLRRRTVPRALAPLLAIMMMLSTSGVALAASQRSLPGDVLYAVKRGSESAQLVFARSPGARAQLQLAFAENRLDEIRKVADSRPDEVPALVADIDVSLAEVDRSAPESALASERIRRQTTDQIAQLSLPTEVTQAVEEVISTTPAAPAVVSQSTVTDPPKGALSAAVPRVEPKPDNDVAGPAPVMTATDPPAVSQTDTGVPQPDTEELAQATTDAQPDGGSNGGEERREVDVSQSAAPDDGAMTDVPPPTPVPGSPADTQARGADAAVPTPSPSGTAVVDPPAQPVPVPLPTPTPAAPRPAEPPPVAASPDPPSVDPPSVDPPPVDPAPTAPAQPAPTLGVDVIVEGNLVRPAAPPAGTVDQPVPAETVSSQAFDTTAQAAVAPAVVSAR